MLVETNIAFTFQTTTKVIRRNQGTELTDFTEFKENFKPPNDLNETDDVCGKPSRCLDL